MRRQAPSSVSRSKQGVFILSHDTTDTVLQSLRKALRSARLRRLSELIPNPVTKTTRGYIFRWEDCWVVSTGFHDERLDRPWSDLVFFAPAWKRCWTDHLYSKKTV